MIQIIILSSLLLYYLSGALPWRILKKENYHFFAVGIGDKIIFFVDGDKGWFPWVLLPWPFRKIEINWKWTFDIPLVGITNNSSPEDIEKAFKKAIEGRPKKNSIGNPITYVLKEKVGGLNRWLVEASDRSYRLRKKNNHSFTVPITLPFSGLIFEALMRPIFVIEKPMRLLALEGNISGYAQGEVDDAMCPTFTTFEETWMKEDWPKLQQELAASSPPGSGVFTETISLASVLIRNMERLRIDDVDKIQPDGKTDFRKYLWEKKFRALGFNFGELNWTLGYGKTVEDILQERRNQQKAEEETATATKNEKLKVVTRQTAENDAENKAKIIARVWAEQKKVVQDFYNAKAAVIKEYKDGLKVLSNSADPKEDELLKTIMGVLAGKEVENG